MKHRFKIIAYLCLIFSLLGCKENQIADDSPCPSCPVVQNVTPALAQEGNEVTITGQRFGSDKSKVTVDILTTPQKVTIQPADLSSVIDTEIKFKVPAGKQGAGKVVVKVNVGIDILASDDAGITPKPADIIFSFKGKANITNTTSLSGRVGETVTVTGINFGTKKEDINLKIGTFDIPAGNITSVSETEIKFVIPTMVPETGAVTVSVAGFAVTGALNFEYKLPKIGTAALAGKVNDAITLAGQNFGTRKEDVSLKIGALDIAQGNISSVTDTEIKFILPRGVPAAGAVAVKVAGYASKENVAFQYNLPKISSTTLTGAKDAVIDIAGDNFGTIAGDVKVIIGTTNVPVQSLTNTLIKVKIPKGLANGKTTVKVIDYEAKELPEFLYKWTSTVTTLRTVAETGNWVIDPADESIYFITLVSTSLTVKKYNPQTKALDAFISQTISSNLYNLNLAIANSGMLFIPYATSSQTSINQLFQIGLEKNLAAIYNGKQALGAVGQSGTVNIPTNLQTLQGVTSLGIENRQNMFIGIAQQFYRITTDQTSWTAPFTNSTVLGQLTPIAPAIYADSKVYIPIAGGFMAYDAVANKLNDFVGSKTAMPYTSVNVQGDGAALSARFNNPYGITKGPINDSFIITDTDNSLIRAVTKNTAGQYVVSTIGGVVGQPGATDGLQNKFQSPKAIYLSTLTTKGVLFIIDNNNKSLRSMTLE